MSIEWNLRKVMAKNNVWTGIELQQRMKDNAGYSISTASISALMNEEPKMIRIETLDALCTALECLPNDLINHKRTFNDQFNENDIGTLKVENKNKKSLPPI